MKILLRNIFITSDILVRLLGKCLALLQFLAKKEGKPFKEVLSKCEVNYSQDYATFLIRLSKMIDEYPRLLKSDRSLFWFKANMGYIEQICMENRSEWSEVSEQYSDDEMYVD